MKIIYFIFFEIMQLCSGNFISIIRFIKAVDMQFKNHFTMSVHKKNTFIRFPGKSVFYFLTLLTIYFKNIKQTKGNIL